MRRTLYLLAFIACLGLAAPAGATLFQISTFTSSTLGGQALSDGDVGEYDTNTMMGSVFLSETLFGVDSNVDGFSILPNGNVVLTTTNASSIGGLAFTDGDLVEYNPFTDTATEYFDELLFFTGSVDVDAVHVFSNGTFLISTTDTETLFGLTFRDGDLALVDPVNMTASLFFDEDTFVDDENVDGVSMLNGELVLSTADAAQFDSGLAFSDGDLVTYNTGTGATSLLLAEGTAFGGDENIDAVSTPEPASGVLLGLGLALLAGARTRRR